MLAGSYDGGLAPVLTKIYTCVVTIVNTDVLTDDAERGDMLGNRSYTEGPSDD